MVAITPPPSAAPNIEAHTLRDAVGPRRASGTWSVPTAPPQVPAPGLRARRRPSPPASARPPRAIRVMGVQPRGAVHVDAPATRALAAGLPAARARQPPASAPPPVGPLLIAAAVARPSEERPDKEGAPSSRTATAARRAGRGAAATLRTAGPASAEATLRPIEAGEPVGRRATALKRPAMMAPATGARPPQAGRAAQDGAPSPDEAIPVPRADRGGTRWRGTTPTWVGSHNPAHNSSRKPPLGLLTTLF